MIDVFAESGLIDKKSGGAEAFKKHILEEQQGHNTLSPLTARGGSSHMMKVR